MKGRICIQPETVLWLSDPSYRLRPRGSGEPLLDPIVHTRFLRTRTVVIQFRYAFFAVLAVLVGHGVTSAASNIKIYPQYKCCYTLPGDKWSWLDQTGATQAICAAENGSSVVFSLNVLPMPPGTVIDEKFAAGFEPDGHPSIQKRGGRITTFKGLPCYECEWTYNGDTTSAIRVVIANGFAYQLQLIGNADPVEKRPDFDGIMNGFEFTTPPVAPDPLERGRALARNVGEWSVYCVFGALVLGFFIRGVRRK